MLNIYFERRSEMTAFAKHSGMEVTRCKQPCEHVEAMRDAILLSQGDQIVARLVRCKVCNHKQLGK